MDYLQALEKFPSWFFYTLILTPGIFYLQYVEGTNLLDYSGFLIFILLIKSLFFGFLFILLVAVDTNLDLIKQKKMTPDLRGAMWKALDNSRFESIILIALLSFLLVWGIYSLTIYLSPFGLSFSSFNQPFLFWIIYFIWLMFLTIRLIFHTILKR